VSCDLLAIENAVMCHYENVTLHKTVAYNTAVFVISRYRTSPGKTHCCRTGSVDIEQAKGDSLRETGVACERVPAS